MIMSIIRGALPLDAPDMPRLPSLSISSKIRRDGFGWASLRRSYIIQIGVGQYNLLSLVQLPHGPCWSRHDDGECAPSLDALNCPFAQDLPLSKESQRAGVSPYL